MKKLFTLIMLMVCIIGCTSGETNQPAELPPAESASESAVNPVEEPVENPTIEEPTEVTNPDVTMVAPSGSINLSQLTPKPPSDGGDLIIQPAPGIPNPEVKMIQLASEDLANRLGIDMSGVTLVDSVSQEWPDSSLGCPSPDLIYLTVITPGFQITLEDQGQSYDYHTDTVENVVLCVDGRPAE